MSMEFPGVRGQLLNCHSVTVGTWALVDEERGTKFCACVCVFFLY